MGRYERSIKIAFDKRSGEVLDADKVFDSAKNSFEIRRQYHEKNFLLTCCECNQPLEVSSSKYDRLHFKHKQGHQFCILADGKLSPHEHEKFTNIIKSKESKRHKQIKTKIGQLLQSVSGVDIYSIAIDNQFIIRGPERRRPDVYCKFEGKELVFEIQLSDLSLGYILSRYNFYKKHGMYLIWILDNFNIHNQSTLERDIKYLTEYENFFKLDEKKETLHLECMYKFPFLTNDNKLLTKWLKKSISLDQINFDKNSYQIYYYNFGDNRLKKERDQLKISQELEEAERKQKEEERYLKAKSTVNDIIKEIKYLRRRKSQVFKNISMKIFLLDNYELEVLNSTLDFANKSKKSPLIQWIKNAKQEDVAFIEFILRCDEINLDISRQDEDGKTAFQIIYENDQIHNYLPMKSLFKRGYKLTPIDRKFLTTISGDERVDEILTYTICDRLSDRWLVETLFLNSKLIFIFESAHKKEITGFNYKSDEWIAFANNAIHHHSEYWEYIELAFKRFGIILFCWIKKVLFRKRSKPFILRWWNRNTTLMLYLETCTLNVLNKLNNI